MILRQGESQGERFGVVPSFGRRLPGIEGLRALAASSILVLHAWYYSSPDLTRVDARLLTRVLPDLAFGVTLFFALSGFLLYRPFAAAVLHSKELPSIKRYLRNRALRILPAYWALLIILSLAGATTVRTASGLHVGSLSARELLEAIFFVQNYFPSTLGDGIGPAWSLAIEVIFYLLLPALALLAGALALKASTRAGRRVAVLAPPLLMLAVGLSGKAVAAWVVPPVAPFAGWEADVHSVIERSFWCHADLFAFGMALAVLRVDSEDGLLRLPRHWRKAAIVAALGGYVLTAKMTYLNEQLSYSPYNTLMALVCALLVALVVLPAKPARRPALVRVLEARPLVMVGLVSYSLFLWHEPLVGWMRIHHLTLAGNGGFFVNVVILWVAATALSIVSYRFVEAPAMSRKRRTGGVSDRAPVVAPETSAAAP